jgi:hypothetical protein
MVGPGESCAALVYAADMLGLGELNDELGDGLIR